MSIIKKLIMGASISMVLAAVGVAQDYGDDTPIKVKTVLIHLPISVSDGGGRAVAGLRKDDFQILRDGEAQEISFFSNAETPMSVAILMDLSGSTIIVLPEIRKAAKNFLATLGPLDQGMVAGFSSGFAVLSDFTSDQKKLRESVTEEFHGRIESQKGGGSNMYDAVHKILAEHFSRIEGRKALIILTDGKVHGNTISKEKLEVTLSESDALVYPIFFNTGLNVKSKTYSMSEFVKLPVVEFLNKIAATSGGRLFVANSSNFQGAFDQVAADLKRSYIIGFYPAREDGRSNNLEIKVNRPDVVVRTKGKIRLKPPGEELRK